MNTKINRILCPTDFSTSANNAVEYAAQLAQELNASVTLWSIYEIPLMDKGNSHPSPHKEKHLNDIMNSLEEWCNVIKEEFKIPCGYSIQKESNDLNKTLTHYTNGNNYDLIIIGTNGSDSINQYYFGKTSYNILHQINYPILVINEKTRFQSISDILISNTTYPASLQRKEIRDTFDRIDFVFLKNTIFLEGSTLDLFSELSGVIELCAKNSMMAPGTNSFPILREQITETKPHLIVLSKEYIDDIAESLKKSSHERYFLSSDIPVLIYTL